MAVGARREAAAEMPPIEESYPDTLSPSEPGVSCPSTGRTRDRSACEAMPAKQAPLPADQRCSPQVKPPPIASIITRSPRLTRPSLRGRAVFDVEAGLERTEGDLAMATIGGRDRRRPAQVEISGIMRCRPRRSATVRRACSPQGRSCGVHLGLGHRAILYAAAAG